MIFQTGQFALGATSNWANAIYGWVSQYDNRVTVSDGKLRFDNKFSISIANATYPGVTLIRDDETTQSLATLGYFPANSTLDATLVITENLFYLLLYRHGYANQGHLALTWLKTNDNDFVGVSVDYPPILDGTTFYDVATTETGSYSIGKVANYALETPKIIYSEKSPFVSSIGKIEIIDGLLNCSTIAPASTITIEGKNYYAVGSNTIVQLND